MARCLGTFVYNPQSKLDPELPWFPELFLSRIRSSHRSSGVSWVLSCEVLRVGIPASPYVVPATESIILLPFNGLRRVAASENWPFLPEIARFSAILARRLAVFRPNLAQRNTL